MAGAVAAVVVVFGLGGCATENIGRADQPAAPYVGVFAGEYVDGMPLYRFPAIEVIGSRRSADGT